MRVIFEIITLLLVTVKSETTDDVDTLRYAAAEADMPFFTAFLDDFDVNLPKYTSYMMQNHITLPQAVADYYYHLAPLATDIDLQSDIAKTFPFTEFQTFISAFPWYSSLLSQVGASTLFVPADFENRHSNSIRITGRSSSKVTLSLITGKSSTGMGSIITSSITTPNTYSESIELSAISSSVTPISSKFSFTDTKSSNTPDSNKTQKQMLSSTSKSKEISVTTSSTSKNSSNKNQLLLPLWFMVILGALNMI